MSKKKRQFPVDYDIEWQYGCEVQKMREDLDALEKMGADFITMNAEDVWGNIQITIKAYSYRMETDDEYEARLVEEKRAEERQLKRDIELFEQLKKKLGKTTT